MAEIAIVIPTLNRPGKLEPLLENIAAVTETPHRTYFVAETGDTATRRTLERMGRFDYLYLIGDFGSCAKAMNAGYRASAETHVFTGNDDLKFHPGWDTEALKVDAPIVGTNDGHGRMTCFALCRRSFIERESGVFDLANTLYHEYVSQYPDTELAEYAKARGVWGEAPLAVTEHLHWEFGKAERDHPNYEKAQRTCGDDAATYQRRKAEWSLLRAAQAL